MSCAKRIFDIELPKGKTKACMRAKIEAFEQRGNDESRKRDIMKEDKSELSTITCNITGNGHNIQVGGRNNAQSIIHQDENIKDALTSLKELVASSTIPELEKEDVNEAINRIDELSNKELTPDVIERVNKRLSTISSIITSGTAIYQQVSPMLVYLRQCFNS